MFQWYYSDYSKTFWRTHDDDDGGDDSDDKGGGRSAEVVKWCWVSMVIIPWITMVGANADDQLYSNHNDIAHVK